MKRTKLVAIGTLLLLGVGMGTAAAQSLGEVARAARKNKMETTAATHHYDNDNLPTDQSISVVGPSAAESARADATPTTSPTDAAAERQKAADEYQKKMSQQKQKIDSLNKELDLDQREFRLHTATFGTDANRAQWAVDEAKLKTDIEEKQKALEAARQESSDMQEEAKKANIPQPEPTSDSSNDNKK